MPGLHPFRTVNKTIPAMPTINPVTKRPAQPDLQPYRARAIPFAENMPYPGRFCCIQAASFNQFIAAFMHTITLCHGPIPAFDEHERRFDGSKHVGQFRHYTRTFPAFCWTAWRRFPDPEDYSWVKNTLPMQRRGRETGNVTFDGPVQIPILATETDTWMSITPMEILSLRAGLRFARGKVLVGGLGMGWFARRCLEREQVKNVTIVERDPHIISFFGEPLRREFGDRVRFVHGDAFKDVRHARFDSVLYDIWPACGDSNHDSRWRELARTHGNAWAW